MDQVKDNLHLYHTKWSDLLFNVFYAYANENILNKLNSNRQFQTILCIRKVKSKQLKAFLWNRINFIDFDRF